MKLITREIADKLPRLYAQDGKGDEAIVHLKLFTPDAQWTWYITEGDWVTADGTYRPLAEWDPDEFQTGDDVIFFGLVDGLERELGYVSLRELLQVRGALGLPIERDAHWKPKPLKEVA